MSMTGLGFLLVLLSVGAPSPPQASSDSAVSEVAGVAPAPRWDDSGSMVHVTVTGVPSESEIDSFLAEGVFVMDMQSAGGSDALVRQPVAALPAGLEQVLAAYAPIEHVNDLRCDVLRVRKLIDFDGQEQVVRDSWQLVGDVWSDGSLSLERHLSVGVDEGLDALVDHPFAERWSLVAGDLLYAQSGGDVGSVFPARNGAAAFMQRADFTEGQRLTQWLVDPFSIFHSPSRWTEVRSDQGGQVVYQRRRHGGHEQLVVDVGAATTPLVRELRRYSLAGVLQQRRLFDSYQEVLPGALRPTLIRDDVLDAAGSVTESTEYRLTGRPDVLAAEPELKLPEPLLDQWSIWVR